MSTFIEASHPEAHGEAAAAAVVLSGDTLRAAVRDTELSNGRVGAAIGKSDTTISQWLNGKYPGDVDRLERLLREWLRDRRVAVVTGVATIETEISQAMARRMDGTRRAGELSLLLGESGIGKSRGVNGYMMDHGLAICFRALPWNCGLVGLADALLEAADINRIPAGQKRWPTLIEKLTGCEKLLVVDDAHELSQRGLQCVVDLHDKTGLAVVLVGLPQLRTRLMRDSRRARRVGDVLELSLGDPEPLVKHLVKQICPQANGESAELVNLGVQVATESGHFGALEKELKKTARKLREGSGSWVAAFRASHRQLLRAYPLN